MFGMGSFTWLSTVPGTRPGLEWQVCLFLAGISWKDKVADLRLKMAERNVVWFVVTALDEIACECSGFIVGACYPVSQLVLWESVCSQNSVFCMVSKQKTITSGYMACQVGWRRDYFGWRSTGCWGGDCGWSGAVLQPGADARSVVVSLSGQSTPYCDTSEQGRFLQTFCSC